MSNILEAGLDNLGKKDPMSYGFSYIDLLQGRKWENRPWQQEIYASVNPVDIIEDPSLPRKMVVMKPTQVGLSTMGIVKNFHFVDYWNVRTIYTLPRQQDVTDMVSTRIEPMISASPRLFKVLGKPDSTRVKRLRDSYMFFMELSVEPRMMPADAVYIDEVDLSDQSNMETAINRLDASNWQLLYYFSTPTISNFGIHSLYGLSDHREWFVKCDHCGYWQVLDWEKNIVVRGPERDPDEVFYCCQSCRKELTKENIDSGRWVAAHPEKSEEMTGFHVSQMMTHPAGWLYKNFIEPKTTLSEFYRKRLGKPYEIGGGSLKRDDFLQYAFPRDGVYFKLESQADAISEYYMGVDQGNALQVLVYKVTPPDAHKRIVWLEEISFEEGFDKLDSLMYRFGVTRCVIDADPNRHDASNFEKRFRGRVWLADYSDKINGRFKKGKDTEGHTNQVVIHRTRNFDNLLTAIVQGEWLLPGQPPAHIPQVVEKLISHVRALRRDISVKRTTSGEERKIQYRSVGPDHFSHSMGYAEVAESLKSGSMFRSRRVKEEDLQEKQKDGKIDKQKRRIIRVK